MHVRITVPAKKNVYTNGDIKSMSFAFFFNFSPFFHFISILFSNNIKGFKYTINYSHKLVMLLCQIDIKKEANKRNSSLY